tara:strand:- start:1173 stop:1379 length:207 start_codon:yes stop_codon:yes gene_type:complete
MKNLVVAALLTLISLALVASCMSAEETQAVSDTPASNSAKKTGVPKPESDSATIMKKIHRSTHVKTRD